MRAWIHDGYPGGSRQEFGNPINLAWKQQPCKEVLHSTEGGGYPSAATYDDGRRAPHVTVDPWGPARSWRQHYPLTEAAWALKAGAVSTNTMGAVQVEIIGTCDPRNAALAHMYVPGIAGEDLAYLVGLLRYLAREAGIPWRSVGLVWRPYPASYGVSASQRLSASAWSDFRGVIGHQHVPGNSHGDPGAIPIDQWLALGEPTAPEEDDTMPTPDEIARAILNAPAYDGGPSVSHVLRALDRQWTDVTVERDGVAVPVLQEIADAKTAALAAAKNAPGAPVDLAAIAAGLTITPREG